MKHFYRSIFARGINLNGFGIIYSGEYETYSYLTMDGDYIKETADYTHFAIGFGFGGKFVSQGVFMLDLNGGICRNLLSNNSPTIVGHFMVNLGFRF